MNYDHLKKTAEKIEEIVRSGLKVGFELSPALPATADQPALPPEIRAVVYDERIGLVCRCGLRSIEHGWVSLEACMRERELRIEDGPPKDEPLLEDPEEPEPNDEFGVEEP